LPCSLAGFSQYKGRFIVNRLTGIALAVALASPLSAQSPAAVRAAANTITPQDVARRIGIIAHDSMRGRDTPSPELEEVAEYIAGEFRRFRGGTAVATCNSME
jgi:hypothetical protein